MPLSVAQWIADLITGYVLAGLLFVLVILPRLVLRLDEGLHGASPAVRLLIAPGLVLLWPVFLVRLLTGASPPVERNAHRRVATAGRHGGRP